METLPVPLGFRVTSVRSCGAWIISNAFIKEVPWDDAGQKNLLVPAGVQRASSVFWITLKQTPAVCRHLYDLFSGTSSVWRTCSWPLLEGTGPLRGRRWSLLQLMDIWSVTADPFQGSSDTIRDDSPRFSYLTDVALGDGGFDLRFDAGSASLRIWGSAQWSQSELHDGVQERLSEFRAVRLR